MTTKQVAVERVLEGYRDLVEMLSAQQPHIPDPGVTMSQMRLLMLLSALGETRMSDLTPKLGIALSSLSSLVDRLVEHNLAVRREDARDRRNVLVSIAPAGEQMLDTFQELGIEQLRLLLDKLDDSQIETVTTAVDYLVGAARQLAQEDPA